MEPLSSIRSTTGGEDEGDTPLMFDLIDMNDVNPCLLVGGSPSQQSADATGVTADPRSSWIASPSQQSFDATGVMSDLRTPASSIASSYNPLDCLSPHQESSFDQRSAQGAPSLISYPGDNPMTPPFPHQSMELHNRLGTTCAIPTGNPESFQKFAAGSLPLTPASSIFEDDFAAASSAAAKACISPVWSHCSGDPPMPASSSVHIAASTKSSLASSPPPIMFTAPAPSGFIGMRPEGQNCMDSPAPTNFVVSESLQTFVANTPTQLASLQELNHVGDSPSPAALSTASATDTSRNSHHSGGSSENRRKACVSLQYLFDAEVAVLAQEQTGVENVQTGYLNPVSTLSECGEANPNCDAIVEGEIEAQSLVSYDALPWRSECSRQDVVEAYQSPSMTSFNTVISDGPMCRICHEGDQSGGEYLISPCRCTGTLRYLHRKCLEQWLQTRNSDVCELCNYEIRTERKTRPVTEWFRHPSNPRDRRNFTVDMICGLILTPMVLVSAWLCLNGSSHYMHHQERSLEGMGLVLLAVVLILIFTSWGLLTTRYHFMVWREWSKHNQVVRVLTDTHVNQPMTSTPQRAAGDVEGGADVRRGEPSTTCSISMSNQSSRVVDATSV